MAMETCHNLSLIFKVFSNIKPHSACKRIKAIEAKGLIKLIADKSFRNFFWTLTNKGFKSICPYLPALEQEGYRTEFVDHDHLLMSFHLGEWLVDTPKDVEYVSEQQLRRYSECQFPEWVPKDSSHRPDGFWNVHKNVIAVEVELTSKRDRDYYTIAKYYDYQEKIDSVIWLVPSEIFARYLLNKLISSDAKRIEIHSFVIKSQFLKLGWGAQMVYGKNEGKKIDEFLGRFEGDLKERSPVAKLLDTRIWPMDFK